MDDESCGTERTSNAEKYCDVWSRVRTGRTPPERKEREMKTTILPCTCKHQAQDRIYGENQRLHNAGKNKSDKNAVQWVCTVCGKRK